MASVSVTTTTKKPGSKKESDSRQTAGTMAATRMSDDLSSQISQINRENMQNTNTLLEQNFRRDQKASQELFNQNQILQNDNLRTQSAIGLQQAQSSLGLSQKPDISIGQQGRTFSSSSTKVMSAPRARQSGGFVTRSNRKTGERHWSGDYAPEPMENRDPRQYLNSFMASFGGVNGDY